MNDEDSAQLTAATMMAKQAMSLALTIMEGVQGKPPVDLLDGIAAQGAADIGRSEAEGETPQRKAQLIEQAQAAYAELIGGLRAQYD